jgi:hypothetical protein
LRPIRSGFSRNRAGWFKKYEGTSKKEGAFCYNILFIYFMNKTVTMAGDAMQYKYHTKSGSVYVRTVDAYGDTWDKFDKAGQSVSLAGAIHLTRKRLQEIVTDYPVTALVQTTILGQSVAREFFDDVKREGSKTIPEGEESAIFFLIDRGEGRCSLGYSSRIEKIEVLDQAEKPEGVKIRY